MRYSMRVNEQIRQIMKIKRLNIYFSMFFLACALSGFLGCGVDLTGEDEALALYNKAMTLKQDGYLVQALAVFDQMVDYEGTEAYKNANRELKNDGLSIGTAVRSWGVRQLIALENRVVLSGQLTHPEGDIEMVMPVMDLWGTPYHILYSTSPNYYFQIRSAGPDKIFDNNDDLAVVHRTSSAEEAERWKVYKTEKGYKHAPAGDTPAPTVADLKQAPASAEAQTTDQQAANLDAAVQGATETASPTTAWPADGLVPTQPPSISQPNEIVKDINSLLNE